MTLKVVYLGDLVNSIEIPTFLLEASDMTIRALFCAGAEDAGLFIAQNHLTATHVVGIGLNDDVVAHALQEAH